MLREYFTFTANQLKGIVILMSSILICLLTYFLLPLFFDQQPEKPGAEWQQLMAGIKVNEKGGDNYGVNDIEGTKRSLTPFPFDPNTLDSAGFKKLGLRDKLVRTLLNYRNKGGRFYNAESLKRIYGLAESEYLQLEPYIVIADNGHFSRSDRPAKKNIIVELNSADTAQLVALRGIGSKLSQNIIQYRKQLGGFVKTEQLKEVYGISAETYVSLKPFIKVNPSLVKKINLNSATYDELNRHPYLRGEIARAIVVFRKKNDYHLSDLQQLIEIELINEEIFRKIAPYLTLQ